MAKTIAISVSRTNGLDSPLDPRFGRAGGYIVVEQDTRTVVAELENRFAGFAHGAGTGAAGLMDQQNVDIIISGRFGPKAEQALAFFGVEMWTAPEGITVGEALDRLAAGELERW